MDNYKMYLLSVLFLVRIEFVFVNRLFVITKNPHRGGFFYSE
ncbi:hypothetical protein YE105_C3544 [Yersinia enterocolitica subsp. palearctica 105.5R(r)]|uniref:Uncharacterized protein n=1 Tax=Yersinia enterocolitica W22703 TaxID=913028 RepID=F4N4G8_YEREN|nr:hypothetical protein YE105_C3544 [Yersinia enterocolitica subsp. palearctica 105.5R(r)]CBX72976.1 unknown protein [Yersinia enterocolitica W22703]